MMHQTLDITDTFTQERDSLASFVNRLNYITVGRAVNFLTYLFNEADKIIMIGQACITPAELGRVEQYRGARADTLRISFWGGPPTGRGWYEGTLLTLLIDCFLAAMAHKDDEKVDGFVKALTIC